MVDAISEYHRVVQFCNNGVISECHMVVMGVGHGSIMKAVDGIDHKGQCSYAAEEGYRWQ